MKVTKNQLGNHAMASYVKIFYSEKLSILFTQPQNDVIATFHTPKTRSHPSIKKDYFCDISNIYLTLFFLFSSRIPIWSYIGNAVGSN